MTGKKGMSNEKLYNVKSEEIYTKKTGTNKMKNRDGNFYSQVREEEMKEEEEERYGERKV